MHSVSSSSVNLVQKNVRHIIRHEYAELDPNLPKYLDLLSKNGADECWHKHGTFKEHLFGTWRFFPSGSQ